MQIEDIKKLIQLLDESNLTELCLEEESYKIKLKKEKEVIRVEKEVSTISAPALTHSNPTPQNSPTQVDTSIEDTDYQIIKAPMVGTFYKSPSPESDPYVTIGDQVKAESIVCILEAMKLFNEIQAEVSGEIIEILVEDGQMVEFGQPLFKVK
ncbi:acetyl-CoA carboxylase biotin carboxyl carrier protein [Macrococcus sp. DPC7161]|uniref:acetyl-CoA carboxylase biotin carboxyl carrier protein n=1 Tax=Macrococcus sp. DPC7161 TaxID=2507060 RepID=UPI00100C0C0C|nr:acetyl-CoA carboxylase biotin carboxyl carrier protein [Macrococcus sp. DPC7161]RXK19340.1 acetyl-CoA carboxylase biotin carboxyl carrier protein [Macrococcus sp. DPC7161]